MKDISIGIYHKDHQYGKRLMEYLNHQKDFPMTASFTSDEEMFFKQEQKGDLNVWYWQKRRIIMEIFRFAELEQMNLWVGCIARVQKRSQRESIIA